MLYTVIFILCQLYPHSLYQTEIYFDRLSLAKGPKIGTVEVFALLDYLCGFLAKMQKMFFTAFSSAVWNDAFAVATKVNILFQHRFVSPLLDVAVPLLMTFRSSVTLHIYLTCSPSILLSFLPGTSHPHDEAVQQYLRDCYIYNTSIVLQKLQELQKNWNILHRKKEYWTIYYSANVTTKTNILSFYTSSKYSKEDWFDLMKLGDTFQL